MAVCSYHGADDGVQYDRAELIEERPCRHEVAGIDDDWRQKNEEERASVELMVVNVVGVSRVQRQTDDNSKHDQQATLRYWFQQILTSVVSYTDTVHAGLF